MHYVLPEDRQQLTLIQSLDDLVASDHYVRLIDALVEAIVSANPKQFIYKGQNYSGRRAYNPITFLKLFIYGYLNSIKSSRKLENECYRNIEVIWLLGNLKPDHKSIADYRRENASAIKFVTKKFRHFLKDNGYIKGKLIAIDGSKVKANANKDMLSLKKIEYRLEHLDKQLDQYLEQLISNDRSEDLFEEAAADDSNNSNNSNQVLLDKISKLQQQVENLQKQKEQLQSQSRSSISPADPQAKLMRSRDGMIPAYNAQIAVDDAYHMIAHSQIFENENDSALLEPMLKELQQETDIIPEAAATDKGYYNQNQIHTIESDNKTTCYVPSPKHKNDDCPTTFHYHKQRDEYRCSQDKRLIKIQSNKIKNSQPCDVYQGIECDGCTMRALCTTSKNGRLIHRYHNQDWRDSYRHRMAGVTAKRMMYIRKQIVEHPFGTIKYWMGKIPILLRGKEKVSTEINIYTTVYNFRRLLSIETFDEILDMVGKYDWKIA